MLKIKRMCARLPLLVCICASPAASWAHHSRANFDFENEIRLTGTVTEVRWANPHVYFRLEAENGDNWLVEGHSVPGLIGLGWTRDTIEIGDNIRVSANPDLNPDRHFALIQWLVTDDGVAIAGMPRVTIPADVGALSAGGGAPVQSASQQGPVDARPSTDFSGNWRADLRGVNLSTGNQFNPNLALPLTAAGRASIAGYNAADNPQLDCRYGGFPGNLLVPYGIRIDRYADRLEILKEDSGVMNTVWLDENAIPQDLAAGRHGVASAHFEDERTLIFKVTGYAPATWGIGRGVDSSDQKVVNGRMQLAEDGLTIAVSFETWDPVYLTEPLSRSGVLLKQADEELLLARCDPENSAIHLKVE